MAFSAKTTQLFTLLILFFIHQATSDSPRYVHLTIYQHETLNKSAYMVSDGMPSSTELVPFGSPFGSLVVFHDPLTATEDPNSELVGAEDGTFITSRFDGSVGVATCIFNLNLPGYKGAIIFVGATDVVVQTDTPIVGGTGDFLFVQGYGKSELVKLEGLAAIYRVDLHLYWPPYAPLKNSISSVPGVKSAHFTIYQHDTFNKSAYLVTEGLPGNWDLVPMGTPFGSLLVFKDDLTVTEDPASEVVGTAEGTSICSRFDGSLTVSTVRFDLHMKDYKGSLSFVGGTHVSEASDHPIVGGTGDFAFVQGYGTSTMVKLEGVASVYRLDLHLYWPPYVSSKSSS